MEEEIEILPDRFDDQGLPLLGEARRGGNGRWTQRRGDFEYCSPQPGGTQVRGTWGVAGTDADQVDRIVRDVSGMLAGEGAPRGMGGWLGLAARLLGGALASGGAATGDDGGGIIRGGNASVGYGGSSSEVSRDGRGKGRRSIDDHEYNDVGAGEEEDEVGNDIRRRRRRRREVD